MTEILYSDEVILDHKKSGYSHHYILEKYIDAIRHQTRECLVENKLTCYSCGSDLFKPQLKKLKRERLSVECFKCNKASTFTTNKLIEIKAVKTDGESRTIKIADPMP